MSSEWGLCLVGFYPEGGGGEFVTFTEYLAITCQPFRGRCILTLETVSKIRFRWFIRWVIRITVELICVQDTCFIWYIQTLSVLKCLRCLTSAVHIICERHGNILVWITASPMKGCHFLDTSLLTIASLPCNLGNSKHHIFVYTKFFLWINDVKP